MKEGPSLHQKIQTQLYNNKFSTLDKMNKFLKTQITDKCKNN